MTPPARALRALLVADAIVLLRNLRVLVVSLVVPLFLLVVIDRSGGQLGAADFYGAVAMVLTIGLMTTALSGYAASLARDREHGVFQRLRVTPAPSWTIMASRLLVQVAANLVTILVVLAAAAGLRRLTLGAGDYLMLVLVAMLGGVMFLAIAQALVGLLKSAATVNAAASMLLVVLLLAGLLGPVGVLGEAFRPTAQWTPVGVLVAIFDGTAHHKAWDAAAWLRLGACLGYIAVGALIGIRWFRWDAR